MVELEEIKNSKILIDTDIIIDHLRGIKDITFLIDKSCGNICLLSTITVAEVYSFLFPEEYQVIEEMTSLFKIINVDLLIAKMAGKYRMNYLKSHNLTIPDALIAASAKINNAILITKNVKHFPMDDLQKVKPY